MGVVVRHACTVAIVPAYGATHRGRGIHRLGLLGKEILKIIQLVFQHLVLSSERSIVQFEFVVFFSDFIHTRLDLYLLCLFLLARPDGCFPILVPLHGSDGVQ